MKSARLVVHRSKIMVQLKRLGPVVFIAISGLITISPLSADTLYRSEMDDGLWGEGYRGGGRSYQAVPDNDIYRNSLYDKTLRDDETGDYYDCDYIGGCSKR